MDYKEIIDDNFDIYTSNKSKKIKSLSFSIYIRDEISKSEIRTPLTPIHVKKLLDLGCKIYIQSSDKRIYSNNEYKKIGAIITQKPWYHVDFLHFIILGLKELDNIDKLILHTHIYFSHSYQNQTGSDLILKYFKKSSSILYDLEYFVDSNNNRLTSFGFWAGVTGCGLSLIQYTNFINKREDINNLIPWLNIQNLFDDISKCLEIKKNIKIGLIGSKGNCGQGVKFILDKFKFDYVNIDRNDSKILLNKYDIILNCIKLDPNINETWFDNSTVFTKPILICDISCDYTKPNNPIKLYNRATTWKNPVFSYNKLVQIISIDNLPSLIPKESSDDFSQKLFEILLEYNSDPNKIWERNFLKYFEKIK